MRDLTSFSLEEIEKASRFSPAIANYFRQIKSPVADFSDEIRLSRHTVWLTAALNTFYSSASTEVICQLWSDEADRILTKTWSQVGLAATPLALFALGKLGSRELNLSSDIDIIVVCRGPSNEDLESKIRAFRKLLSENTAKGFVYRVDFDLRPGGSAGSMITGIDQFENHYWSQGEPWERLALTRLRGICGDPEVIAEVEDLSRRFSYRKFIDINLLEDLKSLRQKIHQNLRAKDSRPEANLKLGIGGIRDIELFLQSLMVIHGGRIPQLQSRQIPLIAETLKSFKILPVDEADFLVSAYWFLRDLEHRVQLVRDTQTHSLPERPLAPEIIAPSLYNDLKKITQRVDSIVSSLLGKINFQAPHLPNTLEAQKQWLEELGFSKQSREEIWPNLIESTKLVQKNRRHETARQEFLYFVVKALHEAALDVDMGLGFLLDFIKATRAKSSFYSLLIREEQLLKDLALLFSVSPYLSQVLCSRPELVDSLLLRTQEPFSEDFDQMLDEMAENKLLSEFICALEFLRAHNLENLFSNLSLTADRICKHLLLQLKQLIAADSDLDILCLGKWGGQDLGLRSDLDFIFVTTKSPDEKDFKIAKRFISRLQDPHRGGRLYGLDLRLRPSGTAGPLIVKADSLNEFLLTQAEGWQRQSYLRARFLNSPDWTNKTLIERGLASDELAELRAIREKLTTPLTTLSEINIKYSRGGLIDTELCVQTILLSTKLVTSNTRTDLQLDDIVQQNNNPQLLKLKKCYLELRTVEQMIKLIQQSDSLKIPTDPLHKAKLSKVLALEKNDLEAYIFELLKQNEDNIKILDPIWS